MNRSTPWGLGACFSRIAHRRTGRVTRCEYLFLGVATLLLLHFKITVPRRLPVYDSSLQRGRTTSLRCLYADRCCRSLRCCCFVFGCGPLSRVNHARRVMPTTRHRPKSVISPGSSWRIPRGTGLSRNPGRLPSRVAIPILLSTS
jgi:hypothetical protein